MKRRSVVVHGHFYQPPREDPWTGRVPLQPSAAPQHDWNERVHEECYRAVVAARLLDREGRIAGVLNTLEWISWDAGPTLLEWMAREAPATYRGFLEADARSRKREGYGNALATPYHHVILPLASRREKATEVRWGITDFQRRFRRDPEGMWLPEAAVDTETLEVLAEEGIRFTVLGPTQVESVPAGGLPGRVALSGGRSIAVFIYDGALSHDVAFGEVIQDSARWLDRLLDAPAGSELVSVATDGETFGHHHQWGEMALAATLAGAARHPDLRVENFGAFLERHPPAEDIRLVEPSSWSCVHGVERWRGHCGCKIDPSQPTSQAWRSTLREVLGELADALHARFQAEGGALLRDPWAARDDYGAVQDAGVAERAAFLGRHQVSSLDEAAERRAFELLDMERDLLRMDTSCAWFFDDVARLEPLQNLLYAAHALDLAGTGSEALEERLVRRLEEAISNDPGEGSAAQLWRSKVRGTRGQGSPSSRLDSTGLTRVVSRALAMPSVETVNAALAGLDGSAGEDPYDAQTAVARAVGRLGSLDPHTSRLADRLGVATDDSGVGLPAGSPLRFVFGLHLHQPVGNFDEVFRSHVEDVYLPFLERCSERGFLPMALHVSGPLLEWLDGAGHAFLDVVARLVDGGALEPLLSGFYEPVLPALSRDDRIGQIGWMRDWLADRFGADARGLWLTERVWEPGLARDLVDAGVGHVLLDDRHFLVAGFERHELDRPWRTESEGGALSVLPIDEHLRYLVPFRSPPEIGGYLRRLAAEGRAMAVLADDGEKFGGWPGTAEWVWKSGWLEAFFDEMEGLVEEGVIRLATPASVVDEIPAAGLAYLPSASYREMELWSLPPRAAETLERAGELLEGEPNAANVLRGGHWRNFLSKYEESNRLHKKAQILSELCREAGDPEAARRAIGRAQCNDAYWHGVFGGLYLRHLRNALWRNLAEAERILRTGQRLAAEWRDVDDDGTDEIWIHSAAFSAVVRPHRGGTLAELTDFGSGVNLVDVLTRRRESYHRTAAKGAPHPHQATEDSGMPSIHELEEGLRIETLPPVDLDVRALLVDRVLPSGLELTSYTAADYTPVHSWAGESFDAELRVDEGSATVWMKAAGVHRLEKTLSVTETGSVEVSYAWDPAAFPADASFAPELSVARDPGLTFDPAPLEVWRHDIVTVSKRESGFEETVQGESITPCWDSRLGAARLVIPAPSGNGREPAQSVS